MVGNLESELLAEIHLADLRQAHLPVAGHRTLHEHEVQTSALSAATPAWRLGLGWLGARLVAAGERVRALGPVTAQPGT